MSKAKKATKSTTKVPVFVWEIIERDRHYDEYPNRQEWLVRVSGSSSSKEQAVQDAQVSYTEQGYRGNNLRIRVMEILSVYQPEAGTETRTIEVTKKLKKIKEIT